MSDISWEFESSMTSEMLTKKGRCCGSRCIHCPYGHTIKMEKLKFHDYKNEYGFFYDYLDQMKVEDFKEYKLLTLKNIIIGFIKVNHLFVLDLKLRPEFQNQNISKELVESYYFY